MRLKFKAAIVVLSAAFGMMTLLLPGPAYADQPCDIRALSDRTKAISKLSSFQYGLNFLVFSQSVAIIEIETGAPVWPIHVEESDFFGPLVGLRKFTDKTETYLNNLNKDIRRLSSFDAFRERFEDIERANKSLVEAGYEILAFLEDDKVAEARRSLSSKSLPTLESVRGDIYTTVLELEKSATLDALHCR